MTLFETKAAWIIPKLMADLQLTKVQACGILGNIGHETGGFKYMQELKPVVAGSAGGFGWAQWTGPRRRAFEAWAKAKGLNPSTDEANYGFLVYELTTTEKAALAALRGTQSIETATTVVCTKYERPGVQALTSRLAYAKQALAVVTAAPSVEPPAKPTSPVGPIIVGAGGLAAAAAHSIPWVAIAITAAVVIGVVGFIIWKRKQSKS